MAWEILNNWATRAHSIAGEPPSSGDCVVNEELTSRKFTSPDLLLGVELEVMGEEGSVVEFCGHIVESMFELNLMCILRDIRISEVFRAAGVVKM